MDHADIAAETIATCQAEALRAQIGRSRPPARLSPDCAECGDEIPEARRATGAVTCIECQVKIEARRLMRSHNIRIQDDE